MRRSIIAAAAGLAVLASLAASAPATAQRSKDDDGGVKVGRPSLVRNLVPAAGRLQEASAWPRA